MQRLTQILIGAAFLCLALILSLTIWRAGGGWGAGVSGFVAAMGVLGVVYLLVARGLDLASLRGELGAIREAHLILTSQLEKVDARLTEVVETVTVDALRRSEELSSEVHMLEDTVQRMAEKMEAQLSSRVASAPMHAFGHSAQSEALLDTVKAALAENRVDLYLQPIVSLPQRRTVFYESFSRLRDDSGRVMMPAEYLSVAEPEGLVAAIDNLLLFRCVQIVRRLAKQDRKVGIFCNISLASLSDEQFFPQFLDFLSANKDMAGALIFELGQSAFSRRGAVEARHMARLADLGFRFSLDKVNDLDLDYQDLARADVKFIKVGAQMLLDQLEETDGRLVIKSLPDLHASDFSRLTRRYGVEIIVEKVESERQIVDILDLDLAFGQGHLFGEPRAIRDAVLAETDPPADFMRASMRRAVGY
ncbi:MAG: EAL domain-containing protein [Caulobacter sp.]|nr:EAL domain-containing protein [Caulobacter sp.]